MMVTLCIVHSQIVATNPGPQLSSSKKIHEKQTRRPRFRSRFRSRGERDCSKQKISCIELLISKQCKFALIDSKLLDSSSDKPSGEEEAGVNNVKKDIRKWNYHK